MIFDIDGIEEKIRYEFKDKMLLRKCFTHSSYANEHRESDNELLEFFGDAIIEFVVTEFLYKNSSGDEGKLTEKRKSIVSNDNLLKIVKRLELDKFMLLGKGQLLTAKNDEKLFSSVYEAVVAGIYIDGGLAPAKKFIYDTLIADFGKRRPIKSNKVNCDAKSSLQELVQKNKLGVIGYETLAKIGPEHLPEFRVAVLLNNLRIAEGVGSSKKHAEAEAAIKAIKKLQKQDGKKN